MVKRLIIRERLDPKPKPPPRPRQSDRLTLLDAMTDPKLFGSFFKDLDSWLAWTAFIASVFGLPMTEPQLAIYRECTGRTEPPTGAMREAVLVIGRRGGKSRILALIAVWLACFHDYKPYLDDGELGVVQTIAADKDQAKTIIRYAKAFIKRVPMLAKMITRETQFGLELSNSIVIEVTAGSFRSVRGRTVVAALCDEVAFWQSEDSANPDVEIINAIRPGMLTIPTSLLLVASSPYARKGVLYTMHKRYHGQDDPRVLSWQANTERMNPAVDQGVIAQAYQDDPISASAEYGAQFRSDVEAFIAREAIDAVLSDERERPYVAGVRYRAFTDPAGGSGKDSFTLAIGHVQDGIPTLDVLREVKPPFSPKQVVSDYSELLKTYNIRKLTGDRYANLWPVEAFHEHGIVYEQSAKPKSDLYAAFLPLLNSKKCDLLDNDRLINQLIGLERRTARSGRDSIDHAPGGHDDVANAVAGVLTSMGVRKYRYDGSMSWVGHMHDVADLSSRCQSHSAQKLSALVQLNSMKGLRR
ncbi:MAG: hypothetical protein Q8M31_05445 [Beijerinckiaceae bacterium]|nr:hypothetical protein [Beijerinckiaceae bacterium]